MNIILLTAFILLFVALIIFGIGFYFGKNKMAMTGLILAVFAALILFVIVAINPKNPSLTPPTAQLQ